MDLAINETSKPAVGIMIGDPCGIGPEVVAKAWATGLLHAVCRPVLVGSAAVMAAAGRIAGASCEVNVVRDLADCVADPSVMNLMEPVRFDGTDIAYGRDSEASGRACGAWLDHLDLLARQGTFAATVMGPISSEAMRMAGTLDTIATNKPERAYLLLHSGALTIAHLCDHVPLRQVPGIITRDAVLTLVRTLDRAMASWGLASRRIAVAGFNPHAHGEEEDRAIAPAIADARAEGIAAEGPFSPDSVFRHCIEGRYDVVVAMYHDQGHIAMKTWGFSGNSVVFLGPPYVHTTVAHGVAYEIAGTGKADGTMILNAILNAAYLAGGKGFHE
ncbi:MAG: PdxA family dehydrogenase [Janthinobacterium lividum]